MKKYLFFLCCVFTSYPLAKSFSTTNTVSTNQPQKTLPPKIVGLVPVHNEELFIEQCLRGLALYTDAIIVLDDASEDNTRTIVESLSEKCKIQKIICKDVWHRDEPGDKNKLLQAGREIGGTHFIVIDADELFTATCLKNNLLRNAILALQPGERLKLHWIRLWRSFDNFRADALIKDFIFCDNGKCFYESSRFIHTPRVPNNLLSGAAKEFREFEAHGLLHFQAVNWRNMRIRQAWYRCIEHIRDPNLATRSINRAYALSEDETNLRLMPSPTQWFDGYDFFKKSTYQVPEAWREQQVLQWFKTYGRDFFAELDIWDIDWGANLN